MTPEEFIDRIFRLANVAPYGMWHAPGLKEAYKNRDMACVELVKNLIAAEREACAEEAESEAATWDEEGNGWVAAITVATRIRNRET